MTTMFCARAGVPARISSAPTARRRKRKTGNGFVMVVAHTSAAVNLCSGTGGWHFKTGSLVTGGTAGRRRGRQRAQADLEHERVAQYGRRAPRRVAIRRYIVRRQHEAIVDIAGA